MVTIEQARIIITLIRGRSLTFTSHDFIGEYIRRFEFDYIDMLNDKRTAGVRDGLVFQTVNSHIGSFLSDNMTLGDSRLSPSISSSYLCENELIMLSKEEIVSIVAYGRQNKISYNNRCQELGIQMWRFYEAKRLQQK